MHTITQVRASLESGDDAALLYPGSASLSISRGFGSDASLAGLAAPASLAAREEAFLAALQQQIAKVGPSSTVPHIARL